MITLTIQNGHRNAPNGQTGTSGEVDLIDKVFYAIKTIIDKTYSNSITLSYDDATVKNGATADCFIALHFDGAVNPSYDGGFIDDSPTDQMAVESWKLAQTVADNYFNAMGIRFAPEHRTGNSTNYYAFNFTGAKTLQFIIELGTLTNAADKAKLQDVGKIARLLMNGIAAYYKLSSNASPIGQPPTSPNVPYIVIKQQLDVANQGLAKAQADYKDLQVESAKLLADKEQFRQELQNKLQAIKLKLLDIVNSI